MSDALQLRYQALFSSNIDTLMWPKVRMKHESAHKIQKLPHYSKPLAQKHKPLNVKQNDNYSTYEADFCTDAR